MRIEANNAIALAIILAVCFIYSQNKSSSALIALALILGAVLLLYNENNIRELKIDEKGYHVIPGTMVSLGSYGGRN